MKRKLLLFFAMLSVSIGAWAGPAEGFELKKDDIGTWFANNTNIPADKVIKMEVSAANGLSLGLQELTQILSGSTAKPHYAEYRTKLDETAQNTSDFIANNRLILKVVYTGNDGTVALSDADIAALNAINVTTIDLQDLKPASAFTLTNGNVKNLILPDGWSKDEVVAAVAGCSQLHSAVSLGIDVGAGTKMVDGNEVPVVLNAPSIVAYVKQPGTFYDTMRRLGYASPDPNNQPLLNANTKLGTITPYTYALTGLKLATFLGYPSARDFNGSDNNAAVKFDPDGHFVFDVEADETSLEANAGVGGGTRQLVGTNMPTPLPGANLIKLDLGDAMIDEAHNSDITLSWSYVVAENTKEIIFPTNPALKTIPADCLNSGSLSSLEEICIPGNIEYIKTRSFWISTQLIRHIWTTGTTEHMRYDNGAYLRSNHDEPDHYGHAPLDDPDWNNKKGKQEPARYGTITLPQNLKLIESHSFTARSVSDVYSLNPTTPDCHVDAFSTIMYMGNNTIDGEVNGMITRWSYAQGDADAEYICFLHYPRESGTPYIQRYTDPTREYSVATTWRDGKGNVVYFPNQSEFNRAYMQGTTGYLWYAWDSERVPESSGGNANSFKNVNPSISTGHSTNTQIQANGYYESNDMTDPDKTDRSFYDVRLDEHGQPTLSKPSDLKWYYNTIWEGKKLYPKPETVGVVDEQGNPVMETVPVYDENGNIIYDPAAAGATYEGNYIRNEVDVYVKASDGEYCHQLVPNGEGQYTIGYSYTQDDNGDFIKNSQGNYETYYSWMDTNPSYQGCKRYTREPSGLIKFTNQWGAPRFNLSTDYVLYETYDSEYKTLLDRYNKVIDYEFTEATSSDAGPFWTMRTEIAQAQEVTMKRDYRGWHQFVLHAYDTNDDRPLTPVKFYQTDNDWWTVCLPYDLKYSEMIRFFGNGEGNIPYLSKLRYVVRDYDQKKITLMFSQNLMVYKEDIQNPSNTDDYVHGIIDDKTKWIGDGEGQYADLTALKAADPIILHKGVPYLIRPNIDVNAGRSFDVFQTETPDLYNRLIDSQNVPASQLETYIYKGEYTVPAYVVGESIPEATADQRSFAHTEFGPTFTYNSSNPIIYQGKEITAAISNDFSYTFVGSFFLSVLPQYCYFLGWDSKNSRAAFWYNRVPNLASQDWNNQTGIICPNFNTSKTIDPATSLSDPARWILTASDVKNDDLIGVTQGAKTNTETAMEEGGAIFSVDVVVNGIGKINTDDASDGIERADVVYDLRGVRMNQPLKSLPKGIYIVNGKKYVVK